jgi:hypothetical protein
MLKIRKRDTMEYIYELSYGCSISTVSRSAPVAGRAQARRIAMKNLERTIILFAMAFMIGLMPYPSSDAANGQTWDAEGDRPLMLEVRRGVCCLNGRLEPLPEPECRERNGRFFEQREIAERECRGEAPHMGMGACCLHGRLEPLSERECLEQDGRFFERPEDAEHECRGEAPYMGMGACCLRGRLEPLSERECLEQDGRFFERPEDAERECGGEAPIIMEEERRIDGEAPHRWMGACCLDGRLEPLSEPECREKNGIFLANGEEAEKTCRQEPPQTAKETASEQIVRFADEEIPPDTLQRLSAQPSSIVLTQVLLANPKTAAILETKLDEKALAQPPQQDSTGFHQMMPPPPSGVFAINWKSGITFNYKTQGPEFKLKGKSYFVGRLGASGVILPSGYGLKELNQSGVVRLKAPAQVWLDLELPPGTYAIVVHLSDESVPKSYTKLSATAGIELTLGIPPAPPGKGLAYMGQVSAVPAEGKYLMSSTKLTLLPASNVLGFVSTFNAKTSSSTYLDDYAKKIGMRTINCSLILNLAAAPSTTIEPKKGPFYKLLGASTKTIQGPTQYYVFKGFTITQLSAGKYEPPDQSQAAINTLVK